MNINVIYYNNNEHPYVLFNQITLLMDTIDDLCSI